MNRRQFLTRAALAIPAIAAPAALLEALGRATIFLPPRGGWPGPWWTAVEWADGWSYDNRYEGYEMEGVQAPWQPPYPPRPPYQSGTIVYVMGDPKSPPPAGWLA